MASRLAAYEHLTALQSNCYLIYGFQTDWNRYKICISDVKIAEKWIAVLLFIPVKPVCRFIVYPFAMKGKKYTVRTPYWKL